MIMFSVVNYQPGGPLRDWRHFDDVPGYSLMIVISMVTV